MNLFNVKLRLGVSIQENLHFTFWVVAIAILLEVTTESQFTILKSFELSPKSGS